MNWYADMDLWYGIDAEHNTFPIKLGEFRLYDSEELRRVGSTETNGYRVSTTFLGLNHNHGSGPPLLFETMTFHLTEDDRVEDFKHIELSEDFDSHVFARYATWEEALEGHVLAVVEVQCWEMVALASTKRRADARQRLHDAQPSLTLNVKRKPRL